MARLLTIRKRLFFAMVPLCVLLLAGEAVCRVKFFLLHDHDWNYITAPFEVQDTEAMDHGISLPLRLDEAAPPAAPGPGQDQAAAPVAGPGGPAATAAPAAQAPVAAASAGPADAPLQIAWHKPCRDREVWSEQYGRLLPYTYDENCFRGDSVQTRKPADEFRVFVMGGSTVEGAQPDLETWTTRLKAQLPQEWQGRALKVVNTGHSGYGSSEVLKLWDSRVKYFAPDVVLYYEGWNEQNPYSQFARIDLAIETAANRLHEALHYRSMLYTYLVEKYAFSTVTAQRFWVIDRERQVRNLETLADEVARAGASFVYVTQVSSLPRYHRGIDTFDAGAVARLLATLRDDPSYEYDALEITALNQRLAVLDGMALFRAGRAPVIDLLDAVEALGAGRTGLFSDLAHTSPEGDEFLGRAIAGQLGPMLGAAAPAAAAAPGPS
ncbi:MAG: SGNH/GDSL hydrolase family protein [Vicinamibacterales bacterium]